VSSEGVATAEGIAKALELLLMRLCERLKTEGSLIASCLALSALFKARSINKNVKCGSEIGILWNVY
jgi:hypothetical protein